MKCTLKYKAPIYFDLIIFAFLTINVYKSIKNEIMNYFTLSPKVSKVISFRIDFYLFILSVIKIRDYSFDKS